MAQQKKRVRVIIIFFIFIAYFILAARPVPRESVLAPKWLSSMDSGVPVLLGDNSQTEGQPLPFILGSRYGYVDTLGNFHINNVTTGGIYLSEDLWTEYDAEPSFIEIKNIALQTMITINNPVGYPILLDDRIFILGSEQNTLSEIGQDGNVLWTYEFGAPITCIDAAAGLVLTGSIDGVVEIINTEGRRIFYFEPGGSRYAVILGCAVSSNGSRIGIISGVDQQRFLMLERFGTGGDYRVVYHEFLGAGFRRPVHVLFVDQDRRIVFERPGGFGFYNIKSRHGFRIPLDGEITAVEASGDQGFLFLINSRSDQWKELVGIRFPQDSRFLVSGNQRDMRDAIFMKASFRSDDVFLGRTGSMLIAGGGNALISLELEER